MQPIYVKNVKNTYFDCTIKKSNAKFFLIFIEEWVDFDAFEGNVKVSVQVS